MENKIMDYDKIRIEGREMSNLRAMEVLTEMLSSRFHTMTNEQKEAVLIMQETLASPLLGFLRNEVPFRLREIFGIHTEDQNLELVSAIIAALYDDSDIIFDYDKEDEAIEDVLTEIHSMEKLATRENNMRTANTRRMSGKL